MALTQVTGPYPIFTDLDGSPLDDGYLYIGASNQDPETNPIQVFWDSALTIPATQPIRTNSGYPWRNGTPALIYTAGQFSITIRNKKQEFVLYSPVGYGFDPGAISASVVKNDFIGDGVEVDFTLSAAPSTKLATNVFINGVYQEKDSYTLSGNVITFSVAPPLASSIEVMTNETGVINSGNATAISYTASFPGAVQQTVQTKLEQYVSVKDFGAVGDGVADDTAAIQAAIDYAYSLSIGNIVTGYDIIRLGGVTVYLPEGKYIVTDTVNIKDNVMLLGAGRLSTVIQSAYNGPIIRNTTITNYDAFGLGIQKMTIIGDPTKANQVGVAILRDWFGRYEDVVVEGCGSHGWLFKQCIHTRIDTIEGLQCGGNGIRIEDGQNSWADPTPNSLPSNTMCLINSHFYGNEAAGIYLGCVNGVSASVNGCQFYGCSSEYNYKSSQSGGNTGYNVEIRCASSKINEFFSLWVEGGCDAHIYVNTANVATPIRFISLHHSGNGASGNVNRAVIAEKGQVLLDGAYGSGTQYVTIAGSKSPFRLTKATSSMRVYNAQGSTITDNNFVEDENNVSTGLYNNLRMENYGWSYGFQRNSCPSSEFSNTWYKEGDAQPFLAIVPGTSYGLGFGDGTSAPDVYMRRSSANTVAVRSGDFFDVGSAWNGSHLKMGGYRLWVDGSGRLRIKFGAPTSDTDGTVVGTQT